MIFIYIIQGLIHGFADTRRSTFNTYLNTIALVGSTIATVNVYGWSMIWLPFVVIICGNILGGIVIGLYMRHQRDSRETQDDKSETSAKGLPKSLTDNNSNRKKLYEKRG